MSVVPLPTRPRRSSPRPRSTTARTRGAEAARPARRRRGAGTRSPCCASRTARAACGCCATTWRGARCCSSGSAARCHELALPIEERHRDPLRDGRAGLASGARLRPANRRREGSLARSTPSPRPGRSSTTRARSAPSTHALACAARRIAAHDDERAVLVHGDVHQWNAIEAGDGLQARRPRRPARARPSTTSGILMREDPLELRRATSTSGRGGWRARTRPRPHRDLGMGCHRAGVHRPAVHQDRPAARRTRDARRRRSRLWKDRVTDELRTPRERSTDAVGDLRRRVTEASWVGPRSARADVPRRGRDTSRARWGTYAALGAWALVSRAPTAQRAVGVTWLGAAAGAVWFTRGSTARRPTGRSGPTSSPRSVSRNRTRRCQRRHQSEAEMTQRSDQTVAARDRSVERDRSGHRAALSARELTSYWRRGARTGWTRSRRASATAAGPRWCSRRT